jgi:hypothetical protein
MKPGKKRTKIKRFYQASCVFFLVLLMGCKPGNQPTVTSSTPTRIKPSLTASTTATEIGTPTPTPTKTKAPRQTRTPRPPTYAPPPTQTPLPRLGLPEQIEFPAWMKDKEKTILFFPKGKYMGPFENLAFIAAGTWEQFNLPKVVALDGYFWLPDGSGFGLLPRDRTTITVFDVESGTASIYPAPQKMFAFREGDWEDGPAELVGFGDPSDPAHFVLADKGRISPGGKYVMLDYYVTDSELTTIVNLETGNEVQLPPYEDKYHQFEGAWSPVAPRLAVTYMKNCQPWEPIECEDYHLRVFDAETGNLVDSYKNIHNFTWSPDGSQIVHTQDPNVNGTGLLPNPPCIFNTLDGSTNCFNEVRLLHPSGSETIHYAWSPDMKKISYVYYEPSDDPENPLHRVGGFCLITIESRHIDCPVKEFQDVLYEAPMEIAHEYKWSPGGRYVSLFLEARVYGGDVGMTPRLAILDVFSGEYQILGDKLGWYYDLGLWRP